MSSTRQRSSRGPCSPCSPAYTLAELLEQRATRVHVASRVTPEEIQRLLTARLRAGAGGEIRGSARTSAPIAALRRCAVAAEHDVRASTTAAIASFSLANATRFTPPDARLLSSSSLRTTTRDADLHAMSNEGRASGCRASASPSRPSAAASASSGAFASSTSFERSRTSSFCVCSRRSSTPEPLAVRGRRRPCSRAC